VCGVILVVDLDRPERFFLMLTRFSNLGSVMSVGAKLLALKSGVLVLYLFLLHRQRQAVVAGDATPAEGATRFLWVLTTRLLVFVSLAFAVCPAFLLSRTWASPLAASAGGALIFLSTAALFGGGFLGVWAAVGGADRSTLRQASGLLLFLVGVQSVFLLFEGLAMHGGNPRLERLLLAMRSGGPAVAFWGLVVGLGLMAPAAALAAWPARRIAIALSAASVTAGAGAARYLIYILR
jgi:hypothetical protein